MIPMDDQAAAIYSLERAQDAAAWLHACKTTASARPPWCARSGALPTWSMG